MDAHTLIAILIAALGGGVGVWCAFLHSDGDEWNSHHDRHA